jgi:hypothetical protein
MPDAVTTVPEPLPEFPAAPDVLGLRWTSSRMIRTRRGPRRLSKAELTMHFALVWRDAVGRSALERLGFGREEYEPRVLHWGGEEAIDPAVVQEIVDQVDERQARLRSEALEVRAVLEREFAAHAWAVPAAVLKRAEVLLSGERLPTEDIDRAREVIDLFAEAVARAGRAVAKARDSLTADDLARCESPEVRAAVHEACQVMSLADDDRAAVNNGMGWSKATSHRGHWIAELPMLDAGMAAVGMMLVHRHRRQLRDDLRSMLFPEVRRAA